MTDSLFLLLKIFAILIIMIPLNGLILNIWISLAQSLHLSRKLIIITSIGILLSIPELFIALNAIQLGTPELALGNALGTAIILITLIAGVIAINKKELKTNEIFSSDNLNLLSFIALLNILLSFDGQLSRIDGVILVLFYFFYLFILSTLKGKFSLNERPKMSGKKKFLSILGIIAGLVGIWSLSFFLNKEAINLQENTAFTFFSIGAILIAPLGAIPELIFEIELDNKNKSNLTLSELFTSLLSNTTLILGILLIFNPISINGSIFYYFTVLFLAVALLLFNYYSRTKDSLNWKEGVILLTSYILYMLSSLILIIGQK